MDKILTPCHRNKKRSFISGSPSSIFEILHDELLINIFCRLPCETIYSCKCVAKRWLSVISNPGFVKCFLNHKTSTDPTFVLKCMSFMMVKKTEHESTFVTVSKDYGKLMLPNLTLDFLPCQVKVSATFKDLVLCYNRSSKQKKQKEYFVCNPLTRQWLSLPPLALVPPYDDESHCFDALICEDVNDQMKDKKNLYRFRVVVMAFPSLDVMVFCSEIGQWKHIRLTVVSTSEFHLTSGVEGVVCNKIVYFGYKLSYGEFDPFSVTSITSDGATVAAKPLPMRFGGPFLVKFAACRGRLLAIKALSHQGLIIWELSDKNDNSSSTWESKSIVHLTHANSELPFNWYLRFEVAGVQPKDELYVIVNNWIAHQQQLVVCEACYDPVIKTITPRLPQQGSSSWVFTRHRFELQPSPTPLPLFESL